MYASTQLRTLVIFRDPRDSIASYNKRGLYEKWGFQEKLDQFFSVIDNFRYPDYPYTGRLSFFGELLGGVGAMTIVVFGLRHR